MVLEIVLPSVFMLMDIPFLNKKSTGWSLMFLKTLVTILLVKQSSKWIFSSFIFSNNKLSSIHLTPCPILWGLRFFKVDFTLSAPKASPAWAVQ